MHQKAFEGGIFHVRAYAFSEMPHFQNQMGKMDILMKIHFESGAFRGKSM